MWIGRGWIGRSWVKVGAERLGKIKLGVWGGWKGGEVVFCSEEWWGEKGLFKKDEPLQDNLRIC